MTAYEKAMEELESERIYRTSHFIFPSVGEREMDTFEEVKYSTPKVEGLMTYEERMAEHNM